MSGYLLNPIDPFELRKCLMRYQKNHKHLFKETISIKSNGDYNFLRFNEIIYLKADNNTTDFYLKSGKIVSAFKTLKHFEKLLPFYFFRIHHGYNSLKLKGFISKLYGKIFGDKGYLSKDLFQSLFSNGIHLVTKLRKNMKTKPLWTRSP